MQLIILTFSLAIASINGGQIHYVDDDLVQNPKAQHTTIQGAVDVAVSGDTIKVSPGFYQENIWGLSGITLESTDGSEQTIIDGTGLDWSLIVLYGDPSTIKGFTFQNGSASNIYGLIRGGALYVEFTSATITDCVFLNNKCERFKYDNGAIGGAIGTYYGSVIIENCVFENNYCGHDGGAISINYGTGIISNSTFKNNTADSHGGAIFGHNSNLQIMDCSMKANLSIYGGAIACIAEDNAEIPSVTIQNSLFRRNLASNYGYGPGGAVFSNNCSISMTNNQIEDNYGYTAALTSYSESPADIQIQNNKFCGNLFNDWSLNVTDLGGNTSSETCACSGDINSDGTINTIDLLEIISSLGGYYTPRYDVNRDFEINTLDLLAIISVFQAQCD